MSVLKWCSDNRWPLLAIFLWIPAFFIPRYLSAHDHNPPVGVYVAIMGVVAAAVAFRKEPSAKEKAAWIILITLLMIAEVRNLYVDDERRAATFADIEKGLRSAVNGIDTTIQNGQQQLSKQDALLGKTTNVAELARQNLASVTGKDSFPCIVPQSHAVVNGAVPLVVWDKGANVLTGVEIRLLSQTEFLDPSSVFFKPPAQLGTLRPEWAKPLPEGVNPQPDQDGVAHYLAEIWTQNGYYTEVINFRRGKYLLPWAYQYWLTQQAPFHPRNSAARGMMSRATTVCSQPQWSDDLGDGKPTPKS